MSVARQQVAERVRRSAREAAEKAQNVSRGQVTNLDPLTVMVDDDNVLVQDDDFDLSAWMRIYDRDVGIAVEDDVMLHRDGGGYLLFDVVPDHDLPLRQLMPRPYGVWRTGLLADRGNASSWSGTAFVATDDWGGTTYLSDGTSWLLQSSKNQRTVQASAASSVSMSSLDGGTDELYEIDYYLLASATGPLQLRVNGVTSASYWDYYHEGYNSTYGSGNENITGWRINDSAGASPAIFSGRVLLQAKPVSGTYGLSIAATGGFYDALAYNMHGVSNINANVTSFTILSGTGATLTGRVVVHRAVLP